MLYILLVKNTLYHDLIDVTSKKLKILNFYDYIDVTNEAIECDKQSSCDFVVFLTSLKEVLFNRNKCIFLFDTV